MFKFINSVMFQHTNTLNRRRIVNTTPISHHVLLALVLAFGLTFGSSGQTPPAQAAPAGGTEIQFSMLARNLNGNATICVGDDVPIYVRVSRTEVVGNNKRNIQRLPGVSVKASLTNGGIGSLSPTSIVTGWDTNDPGGAEFNFHADEAGKTIISFMGTIRQKWWPAKIGLPAPVFRKDFVYALVDITVEECQYKVTAISRWTGHDLNLVAIIDQEGLSEQAPGIYNGTATVNWVITEFPGNTCSRLFNATSDANLAADTTVENSRQLSLDIAYQPVQKEFYYYYREPVFNECAETAMFLLYFRPDPLKINVPISGGFQKLSQTLIDLFPLKWDISGSASITVQRTTDH